MTYRISSYSSTNMLSMASIIPIQLLKRGRIGGQFKAVSPLFSYYSSISTTNPTKYINNTNINYKNQRYYSTYTPPPANKYHGTPVYNDINIDVNDISDAAIARNSDPEAVFVVTGASRSMGLEFVKQLLSRTKGRILACVLRPGSSPALDSYLNGLERDDRNRVCVRGLDVTDIGQIEALAEEIEESYEELMDCLMLQVCLVQKIHLDLK